MLKIFRMSFRLQDFPDLTGAQNFSDELSVARVLDLTGAQIFWASFRLQDFWT